MEEAEKNILRTHTTAVSARMLYQLAQEGFQPSKFFSIDRVFRNEALDATHLAEFHQIEGVIADYDLSLGDLIGVLEAFFQKLGMNHLRFKPAYNPYTEPSMEIFAFHEGSFPIFDDPCFLFLFFLSHIHLQDWRNGLRWEIQEFSDLKCSCPWVFLPPFLSLPGACLWSVQPWSNMESITSATFVAIK